MFSKILARIPEDTEKLQQWADEINQHISQYWNDYTSTSGERKRETKKLEKNLSNLLDLAAEVHTEELKDRIKETSAALERLRNVNNLEKPSMVDPNYAIK